MPKHGYPSVDWVVAGRGFSAAVTYLDESDFVLPNILRRTTLVGVSRGRTLRVGGTATGAIAADSSRIATLRWRTDQRLEFLVFDLSGANPRLLKRAVVPGGLNATPPKSDNGAKALAIDFIGDSMVVARSGRFVVFNWRTRALESIVEIPSKVLSAVALTSTTVVINSSFPGFKYAPPSNDYAAYNRVTNSRLWSGSQLNPTTNADHSLVAITQSSDSMPTIDRLDSQTGAVTTIGNVPQYANDSANVLLAGAFNVQATGVTWPEQGCYWTKILKKPLSETAVRAATECDFRIVPGSLELHGRTLRLGVITASGARLRHLRISFGDVTESYVPPQIAPRKRTVSVRIGARLARQLRKANDKRVKITISLRSGNRELEFGGLVKIRR